MPRHQANERLVLVKHQDGVKTKRRVTLFLVALVVGIFGFLSGYYQISSAHDTAVSKLEKVSQDYATLIKSEAELRQKVVNLESGREIDARAKQEIQDTIQGLKTEVSALKKDISFYQGIMAPSNNTRGLQVKIAEIKPTSMDRSFNYKVGLAQVADNKAYISGVVAVNVVGQQDDKQLILPLRDISSDIKELGIKFRFKFFQNIEGELKLPEGFAPHRLQIVAQSKGKKASRIEQSFDWSELLANNN